MDDDLEGRLRAAMASGRTVFWHRPSTPARMLAALAAHAEEQEIEWDRYGARGAVARLEQEVAALLGKPAAVMFPSGVMAQQSVLRVWCDRRGSARVALPDLSHLLHHEADGPRRVHRFDLEHLTTGPEVPTAAALARVPGRLGAVLVELPLRDAGCLLPTWEELVELSEAARARGVPLHADGARIWESQPAWGRPLAEVGALVDSIYVSLYKGLAAPSGAVVACDEDVAEEVRLWRTRMGGTLFSLTASAVGGLLGLREHLPRMGEFHAWARALAPHLVAAGFRAQPDPPHVLTFQVLAPGRAAEVNERVVAWAERTGIVPSGLWHDAEVPGWVRTELSCYEACLDHDPAEVAGWLAEAVLG